MKRSEVHIIIAVLFFIYSSTSERGSLISLLAALVGLLWACSSLVYSILGK